MPFTGDLEQLHIVDIIQLLNSARKSGMLTLKGERGESRIIFSNGYIVGASHLNKIRIGTVLVRMNAISKDDLAAVLENQTKSGKERKPLLATLLELGKIKPEQASSALKKLIETTLVELIGWTSGTFTLDTDVIAVSPECSYPISKMEQEISLDAQMALMDALRIFDERQRDRQMGKPEPTDEELLEDVLPEAVQPDINPSSSITADDLGLGDVENLERKIPNVFSINELFNTADIHRKMIVDSIADATADEQNELAAYLDSPIPSGAEYDASSRQKGAERCIVLLSEDDLFRHSAMTVCKKSGFMVFASGDPEEFLNLVSQCIERKTHPVIIIDEAAESADERRKGKIVAARRLLRSKWPELIVVQTAQAADFRSAFEAYEEGVSMVLPRPSKKTSKESFIKDVIEFLEMFRIFLNNASIRQSEHQPVSKRLDSILELALAVRDLSEPSAVSLVLLQGTAEIFERAVTFMVRPSELTGERAIGVFAPKEAGPMPASRLKVSLAGQSVIRDVLEKGSLFFGETDDETIRTGIFGEIGVPAAPKVLLLPMIYMGKTLTVTYADFGKKEQADADISVLEILADHAGLAIENAVCRKRLSESSKNDPKA